MPFQRHEMGIENMDHDVRLEIMWNVFNGEEKRQNFYSLSTGGAGVTNGLHQMVRFKRLWYN